MLGQSPRKDMAYKGKILDKQTGLMEDALATPSVNASAMYGTDQRAAMAKAGTKAAGKQFGQAQGAFNAGAAQQNTMADYLRKMANGQGGPGPAQQAFQAQTAQAARGNVAIAQGNRANPFAAMRAASMANDTAGVEAQRTGQAIALQEQQGAQAQLGQYLSDMRGQQMNMAGMQNQRQFQGLDSARAGAEFYANRETQRNIANQGAQMSAIDRGLDLGAADLAAQEAAYGRYRKKNEDDTAAYVGGLQTIGSIISDERTKENVTDAGGDISKTMRALSAKAWNYKSEEHGTGRHIGVMAQDLEKTPGGAWLVTERNGVKTIDATKAVGALLASNAELTKRLDRMEKKR